MAQIDRYSPVERQREKQNARVQDDLDLCAGRVSADELAGSNGFFSALDVAHARIRRRGRVSG